MSDSASTQQSTASGQSTDQIPTSTPPVATSQPVAALTDKQKAEAMFIHGTSYPQLADYQKCGIDIYQNFDQVVIGKKLIDQLTEAKHSKSSLHELLMNKTFIDNVNNFVNTIGKYSFSQLSCLNDNMPAEQKTATKGMLCGGLTLANTEIKKLVQYADVVDQYVPLVRKMLTKLYKEALEAQKYCAIDSADAKKLRSMMTKLNLSMVDELTYVQCVSAKYLVIVIVILIIIVLYLLFRKN